MDKKPSQPFRILDFAGDQIIGSRAVQQDDFAVVPPEEVSPSGRELLLLLADGIGGAKSGEIASKVVTQSFAKWFWEFEGEKNPAWRMNAALMLSNDDLRGKKKELGIYEEMGTTFIAAWITHQGLYWVSVGDSLIFLIRDQKLTRLNELHTYAAELDDMVRRGEISKDEAAASPGRHAITSALCGDEMTHKEITSTPYPLLPGDIILLCSDGILTIDDILPELDYKMVREKTSKEIVAELLGAVELRRKKNQDNTTMIVSRIGEYISTSLPYPIHSASISLIGDRNENQDRFGCWENGSSWLGFVADGAGGHQGGSLAAQIIFDTLEKLWNDYHGDLGCNPLAVLTNSLLDAHDKVMEQQMESPSSSTRPGKAAVVVSYIHGNYIFVAHVGDCRFYHFRKKAIHWRTKDDSVVQILIDQGVINEDERKNHPDQNKISQAIGKNGKRPIPNVHESKWNPGDSFMMCCDGFWGQLEEKSILRMSHTSADSYHRELEKLAHLAVGKGQGHSDNVTSIFVGTRKK